MNYKPQNSSLVLEVNRTFNKTFTTIFQYLREESSELKISVPRQIFSNFKIGLLGESKKHAEVLKSDIKNTYKKRKYQIFK